MKKSRRPAAIPTPESLANIALFYLSRYAASEGALRRVLQNRLRRAAILHPDFARDTERQAQLRTAIEAIIARHVKSGVLNDAAYAETKINSLRRAGRSRRAIQMKLRQSGVRADVIKDALAQKDGDLDPIEGEMQAALAYAKRRRLGKFRTGATDADRQRKDLASLARAGFTLDVARKVLKSEIESE